MLTAGAKLPEFLDGSLGGRHVVFGVKESIVLTVNKLLLQLHIR